MTAARDVQVGDYWRMQNGEKAYVLDVHWFDEVRHEITLEDGTIGKYAPTVTLDEPKVEITLDVPGKLLYVHAIRLASASLDIIAGAERPAAALAKSWSGSCEPEEQK